MATFHAILGFCYFCLICLFVIPQPIECSRQYGVNSKTHVFNSLHSQLLTTFGRSFLKTLWKPAFSPFLKMFSTSSKTVIIISAKMNLSSANCFELKVVLQILGRKLYKITKKSSLYYQSLLIFIHKTSVVENHPTTGEIRELLRSMSTPTGITVYFYMSSSLIYVL